MKKVTKHFQLNPVSFLNFSPLSLKLENISVLAQAGENNIVSPFLETDIDSISLEDDKVVCHIGEKRVPLPRAEVLKNFWEHRTRTPSYFSHKIWMQFHLKGRKFEG